MAQEQERRAGVDRNPHRCHRRHHQPRHLGWRGKAAKRFADHRAGAEQNCHPVAKRRKQGRAPVAPCVAVRGRPFGQHRGTPGDQQPRYVGQVVRRIRQERERPGPETRPRLDQHESRVEHDRKAECRCQVGHLRGTVAVGVVVRHCVTFGCGAAITPPAGAAVKPPMAIWWVEPRTNFLLRAGARVRAGRGDLDAASRSGALAAGMAGTSPRCGSGAGARYARRGDRGGSGARQRRYDRPFARQFRQLHAMGGGRARLCPVFARRGLCGQCRYRHPGRRCAPACAGRPADRSEPYARRGRDAQHLFDPLVRSTRPGVAQIRCRARALRANPPWQPARRKCHRRADAVGGPRGNAGAGDAGIRPQQRRGRGRHRTHGGSAAAGSFLAPGRAERNAAHHRRWPDPRSDLADPCFGHNLPCDHLLAVRVMARDGDLRAAAADRPCLVLWLDRLGRNCHGPVHGGGADSADCAVVFRLHPPISRLGRGPDRARRRQGRAAGTGANPARSLHDQPDHSGGVSQPVAGAGACAFKPVAVGRVRHGVDLCGGGAVLSATVPGGGCAAWRAAPQAAALCTGTWRGQGAGGASAPGGGADAGADRGTFGNGNTTDHQFQRDRIPAAQNRCRADAR